MKKLIQSPVYFLILFTLFFFSCNNDSDEERPRYNNLRGTLIFSSASQLKQFDLSNGNETLLFEDGRDYALSHDATYFLWHQTNASEQTTTIQIHTRANPSSYETLQLIMPSTKRPSCHPTINTLLG